MPASELLLNLVFYVLAAAALGGGAAVALSKNIVRSAFALLTVLFSVAGLYALMRADFIVAAQILIYVGGILVLIIFAIMLTHRITDVKLSNESSPGPVSATACGFLFFLIVMSFVVGFRWDRAGEVRTVEFALAGRPGIPAELAMWQGDGRTGVKPGGIVLDGFVRLEVRTRAPLGPGARASFLLSKLDPKEKDETKAWKDEPGGKPVRFSRRPDGVAVATGDFERLAEASYRWRLRLEGEEGETAWVGFSEGKAVDFVSEKGLTKALGRAFMGPYLLAFEVVSVLLLAALVGAAFLARKEVRE